MNDDKLTNTMIIKMYSKPRFFKRLQNVSSSETGTLLYLSKGNDCFSNGELSSKVNIITERTNIPLKCLEKKQDFTRHKDNDDDARKVIVNSTNAEKEYTKESSDNTNIINWNNLIRFNIKGAAECVRSTSFLLGVNMIIKDE